ncbi:response regulator [Winogradskyella sediminis]|uniref:Response regulator receiver domain-containing protein n=1 Tax=Winogradskyella sediminis TaxID=1382466 RepID=A0A1H1X1J6_9FLAO|nr:response regulator [Winogradskyella sediminis]REG88184.1 response regulator receiver domain-containing protein [Winogradskyella sediminis]SDT02419.1 Response regulator receiver domain-containing protein [Winogradskyella sediminis]
MSNQYNICIIDDDDIYQYTITKILQSLKLNKKIIAFSDGEEALDFLIANLYNDDELPDVIFLDINMPIMDGFQFMEEYVKLKPKWNKKITIYMVSSSVDPVDIERAKNISEISDYIIKPIKAGELQTIMANLQRE